MKRGFTVVRRALTAVLTVAVIMTSVPEMSLNVLAEQVGNEILESTELQEFDDVTTVSGFVDVQDSDIDETTVENAETADEKVASADEVDTVTEVVADAEDDVEEQDIIEDEVYTENDVQTDDEADIIESSEEIVVEDSDEILSEKLGAAPIQLNIGETDIIAAGITSGEDWNYDVENNILTLNNFEHSFKDATAGGDSMVVYKRNAYVKYAIFIDGDITINLSGVNVIDFNFGSDASHTGIFCTGNLTFTGDGSLNLTCKNPATSMSSKANGIYASNDMVFNGTDSSIIVLDAKNNAISAKKVVVCSGKIYSTDSTVGDATSNNIGIDYFELQGGYFKGCLVAASRVNITGGEIELNTSSSGSKTIDGMLKGSSSVDISGGKVTVNGAGIQGATMNISDGTVISNNIKTITVYNEISIMAGITASEYIYIQGGDITASGHGAAIDTRGLRIAEGASIIAGASEESAISSDAIAGEEYARISFKETLKGAEVIPNVTEVTLVDGGNTVSTKYKTSGEGWSYDATTNTLTLNGYSANSFSTKKYIGYYGKTNNKSANYEKDINTVIYSSGDLNIVLENDNVIEDSLNTTTASFIYSEGNLNISGTGTLVTKGRAASVVARKNVCINSGTYSLNEGVTYDIAGISSSHGDVVIKGGNITTTGTINIVSLGTIIIEDGTISATELIAADKVISGGTVEATLSVPSGFNGDITVISGGIVGTKESKHLSHGKVLICGGKLIGSSLSVSSTNEETKLPDAGIKMSSGTLELNNTSTFNSYAIDTNYPIVVTGGNAKLYGYTSAITKYNNISKDYSQLKVAGMSLKTGNSYGSGNKVSSYSGEKYLEIGSAGGTVVTGSYTIKFEANYPETATGKIGSMADQSINIGASTKLTKNAYECAEYVFVKWNTNPEGKGTDYTDEFAVKNLSNTDGAKITLYAQWRVKTYKLSLDRVASGYKIRLNDGIYSTSLATNVLPTEDNTVFINANAGYVVTEVLLKSGNKQISAQLIEGENVGEVSFVIPAGTLADDTVIQVITKAVADLSKAVITAEFAEQISTGVVGYTGSNIEASLVKVTVGGSLLKEGTDYTISYSEDHKNAGIAYIIVTAVPESKLYSGSKEYAFTIKGEKLTDATKVSVSLAEGENSKIWNGGFTEADVVVKTNDGMALNRRMNLADEDGDYILVYSNNDKPGKAKITVIGVGNYEGSKELSYTITKPSFKTDVYTDIVQSEADKKTEEQAREDGKLFVSLERTEYEYTGEAFKPGVIVKYKDSEGNMSDLNLGTDYTVKYANNVNASVNQTSAKKLPTVTITGKGIYQGSVALNFTINPIDITDNSSIVIKAPSVQYKEGRKATTTPVVSLYQNGTIKTLKAGVDYNKLTADSFTDNEGAENKLGKVTIEGKGNFTGSKIQTFTIASQNIAAKNVIFTLAEGYNTKSNPALYEGKPVIPTAIVKEKVTIDGVETENELIKGEDYLVDYISCDKSGIGTVRISGKGEYYGVKDVKFKINARKVSTKSGETEIFDGLNITLDGANPVAEDATKTSYDLSYEYTGYAYKPLVEIVDTNANGNLLIEGKDYTVKYTNNIDASVDSEGNILNVKRIPKVEISFKGNYSGKIAKTFTILPWSIDDAGTVIAVDDAYYNNGKALTTSITVKRNGLDVNPKSINVVYNKNNPKTVNTNETENICKVTISGAKIAKDTNITLGGQSATAGIEKYFKIIKADLGSAIISTIAPQIYKGKALNPKATVKYSKVALKQDVDYTVSYSANNRKGVAVVTLTAVEDGNFEGSISATFIIK